MATYSTPASTTKAGWGYGVKGGTPYGTETAPLTPAASVADSSLLRGTVSDILGLTASATENAADSEAAILQSQGYDAETDAYTRVGAIADENATIAGVAGNIRALQAARGVTATIGSQKAAVASAGFGASGSSLDLLRDSRQQGYLNDQLIRTQTSLTQGGYKQEGAAAQAEAAGSKMASAAALALSKKQAASGALATANAANQTAALKAYINSTQNGAPLTPAQELTLSTLGDTSDLYTPTTMPDIGADGLTANPDDGYVNPFIGGDVGKLGGLLHGVVGERQIGPRLPNA